MHVHTCITITKKRGGAREQELGGYIMYNFADVYKYACKES